MWLYYCKLRGANDFESVNQLIVADKMFEMLDSETATHIGVLQVEEWYKPRDLGKQCDIFYALPKGNPTMNLRELNGMIGASEDKLSKLVKTSISVDGKLVHALVDSGTEITVIKKDLVPGISVEGASTIYLKGIFGPAVKCPLVYVPIGLATEKAQKHIEDSQRNITSCRNEVGTLGTKDDEVAAEMDKGINVADSFRSEQECCTELALVWKHAKEGKGNYYEVDGYLFHRDKILGESIGQLVIPKCRRTEVLRLAHTSVFSSHMGPKKTLERIKYSSFWEGLRADVKKFCESCKECQLTRSVRIKDRSSSTPVARPELPFEVGNMDLIGPIDSPS
ncbi:retrovirus-related Pol polyprotein from transposon opus [Trichonephila clavipes]|nr:retrovirus-related Pol polyprotein from transposon opus [Trichonephila clavipes]